MLKFHLYQMTMFKYLASFDKINFLASLNMVTLYSTQNGPQGHSVSLGKRQHVYLVPCLLAPDYHKTMNAS